ncbi:MAG: phage head spike fiber domain-containing protein [Acidobacteriaceae bacterium]
MSIAMPNLALNQVQAGSLTVAKAWGSWTGTNTSGVLLNQFGAEPNTARAVNIYRSDWQGNQLLYPTARTNYVLSSNIASNWYTAAGTYGTASTTTPSGTGNAYPFIPDTTNGQHQAITHTSVGTANSTITFFADVAPDGYGYAFLQVQFSTGGGANGRTYNLTTGAVTFGNSTFGTTNTISAESIVALPNGYFRITMTCALTAPISLNNNGHVLVSATGTDSGNFTGNGTSAILIAEGQIAADQAIGSFIATPTTGVVTLTDYTLAGTTVNLAQAPASTAVTTATFYGT